MAMEDGSSANPLEFKHPPMGVSKTFEFEEVLPPTKLEDIVEMKEDKTVLLSQSGDVYWIRNGITRVARLIGAV